MIITEEYNKLIRKLERGERGLLSPNPELIAAIEERLSEIVAKNKADEHAQRDLRAIFCVLDHQIKAIPKLGDKLLALLLDQKLLSDDEIIFALRSLHKHVIESCQVQGVKYPSEVYDIFRLHLKSKNPEVLEWVLRSIDQIGMKSILLKKEILGVKPSPLKLFNPHHKNCRAIISMLEKRWGQINL